MLQANDNVPHIIVNSGSYIGLPLNAVFLQAHRCGCYGLALQTASQHVFVDSNKIGDLTTLYALIEQYQIPIYTVLAKPYHYSLFALEGSLHWNASLSYYINVLNLASSLGAKSVCFCLDGAYYDKPMAFQHRCLIDRLRHLNEAANTRSLRIDLRIDKTSPFQFDTIESVFSTLNLLPCDIGLLITQGVLQTEDHSLSAWLQTFASRIVAVEISDLSGAIQKRIPQVATMHNLQLLLSPSTAAVRNAPEKLMEIEVQNLKHEIQR